MGKRLVRRIYVWAIGITACSAGCNGPPRVGPDDASMSDATPRTGIVHTLDCSQGITSAHEKARAVCREIGAPPQPPSAECFTSSGAVSILCSHPQSAVERGGCLQYIHYLDGSIDPSTGIIEGMKPCPDGSGVSCTVTTAHFVGAGTTMVYIQLVDATRPCPRDGATLKLPRYLVTDAHGNNLCRGVTLQKSRRPEGQDCIASWDAFAAAVPGAWDPKTGAFDPTPRRFTMACASGAIAKCALWGYLPWGRHEGCDLASLHKACVHAAMAQFDAKLGDVSSQTCSGTEVDFSDNCGIQMPDPDLDAGETLEAIWSEAGCECKIHRRFPQCAESCPMCQLSRPETTAIIRTQSRERDAAICDDDAGTKR